MYKVISKLTFIRYRVFGLNVTISVSSFQRKKPTSLESIKDQTQLSKKLANVEDWRDLNIAKEFACIMILVGYQNANIMTAVQYAVNTGKVVRCDMDSCNGHYKAVSSRKNTKVVHLCLHAGAHPTMARRRLKIQSRELALFGQGDEHQNCHHASVLNKYFCYHLYKRCKGQILEAKAKENCLMKARKLPNNELKHSIPIKEDLVFLRREELLLWKLSSPKQ